ncbi:hypothetical protein AACB35_06845 [Enterococcus faecalis]|uniref:hypothetical protein n=1 Tax=Enterococcus faecalis TaxID=1351 RepID=UPI003170571D
MLKKKVILSIVSICVLVAIIFTAFKMGQKTQVNEAKSINSNVEVSVSNNKTTESSSKTLETEISNEVKEDDVLEEFKNLKNDESKSKISKDNKIDYLSENIFHTNVLVLDKGVYETLYTGGEKGSLLYYSPDATVPFFYTDNFRVEMDNSKAEVAMSEDIGSNLQIDSSKYDKFITLFLNQGSGETSYYLVTEKDGEILITLNTVKDEITEENRLEKALLAVKPINSKQATDSKDGTQMLSDFNNEEAPYLAILNSFLDNGNIKSRSINKAYISMTNDNKLIYLNQDVFDTEFKIFEQYLFAISIFDTYFM